MLEIPILRLALDAGRGRRPSSPQRDSLRASPCRLCAFVSSPLTSSTRVVSTYDRRTCSTGPRRRAARSSRGARVVSPRADASARPARRRGSRAEASRTHRHLHHRSQRQLHERLRRALQLLRVLPARRVCRRLRARFRGDLPQDRRDDCARRRAVAAAGRPQPGPAARVVRGSLPRVKERYPAFRLHALSPPEVIHLSRLSQLPVPQVVERLDAAGLDSIPGGGAEILVDRVRKLLHCYNKATADEWLDVMRHAHRDRAAHDRDDDVRDGRDRRGAARAHVPVARAAGRDGRLHGVHHLELSARSHRARRRGSDRRRLPADARHRAPRARQLRQPAGVVGDAGRQGRASSASPTAPTTWAAS